MMTLETYLEEMMNPKYRYLYIFFGAIGFILLVFQIVSNFPEINPDATLLIALPDMVLFSSLIKPIRQKANWKAKRALFVEKYF